MEGKEGKGAQKETEFLSEKSLSSFPGELCEENREEKSNLVRHSESNRNEAPKKQKVVASDHMSDEEDDMEDYGTPAGRQSTEE